MKEKLKRYKNFIYNKKALTSAWDDQIIEDICEILGYDSWKGYRDTINDTNFDLDKHGMDEITLYESAKFLLKEAQEILESK